MIKQIVDVSHPAYISVQDRQLVIRRDEDRIRTPLEDLGMLILSSPAITITQGALAGCQTCGAVVAVCDSHHLPISLLLPVLGGALHAQTLRLQVDAAPSVSDALWGRIVQAKIQAQAEALKAAGQSPAHLEQMALRVRPADPENREAQAAQHYWPTLMGEDFRRHQDGGLNVLLNYGYAVMRAAVARAIVGAGLYPAWGIFHRRRSDNFALADDLMEPLRPFVDRVVWSHRGAQDTALGPSVKKELLALLSEPCLQGAQELPLWVALQRYAASLRDCLAGTHTQLEIPKWRPSGDTAVCG